MEVAEAAVGGTADDAVQDAVPARESGPAPEAMEVPTADVERLNTAVTALEVGKVFTSQAASATSIAGEFSWDLTRSGCAVWYGGGVLLWL